MLSDIRDILTGRLRNELRQRVDEILRYGNEWSKAAKELIEAMNRLASALERCALNPKDAKAVVRGIRKLAKETEKLANAVESHNKLLSRISEFI